MEQPLSIGLFNDGTGTWSYSTSPGVTVTWIPPSAPGDDPTLSIVIDVDQTYLTGGGYITFNSPLPPPGTYVLGTFYSGLKENFDVTLKNDSGYDLTQFDLKLINAVPTAPLDKNDPHPDNYAHFHNVIQSTTFGAGKSLAVFTPDGGAAAFGGVGNDPAPSEIKGTGNLANGASVVGSGLTLHEEEDPSRVNSFSLVVSATFDAPPVVKAQNRTVQVGRSILASSLINSVSDPYGYPITSYDFFDIGGNGGHFTLNGVNVGSSVDVTASTLANLRYVGGAQPGKEQIEVGAWDGHRESNTSIGKVTTAGAIQPVNDFNGDVVSDILWRNANGSTDIWNSNGGGGFSAQHLGIVEGSWQIAGTADFNGDGQADILWRNANGDAAIWNSNGGGGFTSRDLGIVDSSWQIAGTDDFNGDGHADILWRNANGSTDIWNSNGSGGFSARYLGIVDSSWKIAGTADFNDDGYGDILWRNANGDVAIWHSNGSGGFTAQDLGIVDNGWQIAGTGDFNGDGYADILWRNTNGSTDIWNSNGSGGFSAQHLGIVDSGWQIARTGDFNGDGYSDILWRNGNGDTAIWKSNGSGGLAAQDLGIVDTSWKIQTVA